MVFISKPQSEQSQQGQQEQQKRFLPWLHPLQPERVLPEKEVLRSPPEHPEPLCDPAQPQLFALLLQQRFQRFRSFPEQPHPVSKRLASALARLF